MSGSDRKLKAIVAAMLLMLVVDVLVIRWGGFLYYEFKILTNPIIEVMVHPVAYLEAGILLVLGGTIILVIRGFGLNQKYILPSILLVILASSSLFILASSPIGTGLRRLENRLIAVQLQVPDSYSQESPYYPERYLEDLCHTRNKAELKASLRAKPVKTYDYKDDVLEIYRLGFDKQFEIDCPKNEDQCSWHSSSPGYDPAQLMGKLNLYLAIASAFVGCFLMLNRFWLKPAGRAKKTSNWLMLGLLVCAAVILLELVVINVTKPGDASVGKNLLIDLLIFALAPATALLVAINSYVCLAGVVYYDHSWPDRALHLLYLQIMLIMPVAVYFCYIGLVFSNGMRLGS